MWSHIAQGDIESLEDWLKINPDVVDVRSKDGRGPLWWAHERGDDAIVDLLLEYGADPEQKDSKGMRPGDLGRKAKSRN